MTKNWIAVNVLLLLAAALLARQLYVGIVRFRAENDPAKLAPVADVKRRLAPESGLPPPPPPRTYNAAEFEAIAAKNLFAESRSAEERTDQPQVAETPPLDVKPQLVGVIQSGDQSLALIVDPSAGDTRRRAQTKRLGDGYRGYTITEITPTRMVLEAGTRREVIPLYDGSRPAGPGGKTPIVATRVVPFGAGANYATGGTVRTTSGPVVVESQRPAAAPAAGTRAGQTGSQPAARAGTRTGQPASQPAAVQGRPAATPAGAVEQAAPVPGELRDAQGRRIIRTPWGDIVQPEQPPRRPPNQ